MPPRGADARTRHRAASAARGAARPAAAGCRALPRLALQRRAGRRFAEPRLASRCFSGGRASPAHAARIHAARMHAGPMRAGPMQESRCGAPRWVRRLRRVNGEGTMRVEQSGPAALLVHPRARRVLDEAARGSAWSRWGHRTQGGRTRRTKACKVHQGLQGPRQGARGSAAVGGGWFEVDHRCERRPSRAKLGTVGLARGDEARGGAVQGLRLA
ncbi:MAG: hypothetical protein RIR65_64 [Planctomycetota bacterium]